MRRAASLMLVGLVAGALALAGGRQVARAQGTAEKPAAQGQAQGKGPAKVQTPGQTTPATQPVQGQAQGEAHKKARLLVIGRVTWPGIDWFPGGSIVAATDGRFQHRSGAAAINNQGAFILFLNPGNYYLMAHVDLDGDGKVSPGDGIGFYGVDKPQDKPKALAVTEDSTADLTMLRVTFQIGADKGLRAAVYGSGADSGTIRGTVDGGPKGAACYVVAWPYGDGWYGYAAPVGKDGSFALRARAGEYAVFAICDANGNGVFEAGEPAAVYMGEAGAGAAEKTAGAAGKAAGAAEKTGRAAAGKAAGKAADASAPSAAGPKHVAAPAKVALYAQSVVDLGKLHLTGKWAGRSGVAGTGGGIVELPLAALPALCEIRVPASADASKAGKDADAKAPRSVSLFSDTAMKSLVASAWVQPGTWLAVRPATYSFVCGLDLNGDGQLGPSDKMAAVQGPAGTGKPVALAAGDITRLKLDAITTLTTKMLKTKKAGAKAK